MMIEKFFSAGHNFFEQDLLENLYFIKDGKVKAVRITKEGKKQLFAIYKTGDFFGGTPAMATAFEDCRVRIYSMKEFEILLTENEWFMREFIKVLFEKIKNAWSLIDDLRILNRQERLTKALKRFQSFDVKLTHDELAGYIGTSREYVSRIIHTLN